jgi:hypothetical protein
VTAGQPPAPRPGLDEAAAAISLAGPRQAAEKAQEETIIIFFT